MSIKIITRKTLQYQQNKKKNGYASRKTIISSASKRKRLIGRRQRTGPKDLPLKRTFSVRS